MQLGNVTTHPDRLTVLVVEQIAEWNVFDVSESDFLVEDPLMAPASFWQNELKENQKSDDLLLLGLSEDVEQQRNL